MITEELKSLGEVLKKKRKERNLSLKEVENATSIRIGYLQAIEGGDDQKLISPVYAKGFIRQYALFLGIEGETLVKDHPEVFNQFENQEFSYGIGTLESRGNPSVGVKWVPNAFWIAAFVLVIAAAWYFARFLDIL